jgi:hypothetical protein
LYATPTDSQQNLISAGVLANPYTGQRYECFENQLPPGNTDRSLAKSQLCNIQPRLLHMQGGYNAHNPPSRKMEHDGSVFKPVCPRGGSNPFGPQLYTKPVNDRLTDMITRSTYNNRDGDQLVEPAIAKERPANYYGMVPRVRFNPYVVPTNELQGNYVPPAETIGVNTMRREDYTGAVFSKGARAIVANHAFPAQGPEASHVFSPSDHVEPQRSGMCTVMAAPNLECGARQDSTWNLRPTQFISALPVGMVTATVLPPTRTDEIRHTSQGLLACLPTGAPTGVEAHGPQGQMAPSFRGPSLTLPAGPTAGWINGSAVVGNATRAGPQGVGCLPPGNPFGVQAPAVIPVTTTRAGPQGVGTLPTGAVVGQEAVAMIPTATCRIGPQGVGCLPTGSIAGQEAATWGPTDNTRPGPQGVGTLPTGSVVGQEAAATIPTETGRPGPQGVGCLPTASVAGQEAAATIATETGRIGPQGVGCLPTGAVVGSDAFAWVPTETTRAGPQGVGTLPTGAVVGQEALAMFPTEMDRVGPQGVGCLPTGAVVGSDAFAWLPTETTRAGPQGVGCLPVGLPQGQIAPASVPTTMTIRASRPGALPGGLVTGPQGALVNMTKTVKPTQSLDVPLPPGPISADVGANLGATMEMRDLQHRSRDFGALPAGNPGMNNVGELMHGSVNAPHGHRGECETEYQIGEHVDLVEGAGGGARPLGPTAVKGKKMEGDPGHRLADGGMAMDRAPNPVMCDKTNQELRDELANQRAANDV